MEKENSDKLVDLLIYALLPKDIYNHKLDNITMSKFRNIIVNNLNDDTSMLRQKLVDCWKEGIKNVKDKR